MKHSRLLHRAASAAITLALSASAASAQQQAGAPGRFVGVWEGAVQGPAGKLRLGLTVERDANGALSGYMTSIDQGSVRMAATVTPSGDTLTVALTMANARFVGVIAGRDTLRGSFTQGMAIPLELVRVKQMSTMAPRPQDPKAPFPYRTEDVSVESVPGVRLAGTLTIPAGNGPFPAVVFVTGSGAQDRDEALAGHRPFLVLSDYLARKGIASLRYDDRGFAKSTGKFAAATSADFADDAEAAVRWLRSNPAIARDKVGILGHSEGGLIAPMVAARSRDVAFIVLLAGPGLPGDSIILLQQRLIGMASGAPAAAIEMGARINRAAFAAVRAGGDSAAMAARVRDALREVIPAADALDRQTAEVLTPWFRYFLVYDPRDALRKVTVPVLAVNGTLDLQVPYKDNLPAIAAALREGGNKDFTTTELPNLNHLFQTAKTGAPAEYQAIEETMSPVMLDAVSSWILTRFGKR